MGQQTSDLASTRADWIRDLRSGDRKLEDCPSKIRCDYEVVHAACSSSDRKKRMAALQMAGEINAEWKHDDWLRVAARVQEEPPQTPWQICISKKFAMKTDTNTFSLHVVECMLAHPVFKGLRMYNPDFFNKGFCLANPSNGAIDWARVTDASCWCRGGRSCGRPVASASGRPTTGSCWRYSYNWHIIKVLENGGFLLQIIEIVDGQLQLGLGQIIEEDMAMAAKIPILRIEQTCEDEAEGVDEAVNQLAERYKSKKWDVGFYFSMITKVSVSSSSTEQIFRDDFNKRMEKFPLSSSLQTLEFGDCFNQSMEQVALPSSLKNLEFGVYFNQSMEKVALPSSLETLKFGNCFNQSMEKVALPSSLQTLEFVNNFNHSMEKVALPSSLQTLKFSFYFNQSMEKVALPSGLKNLEFGGCFNQSMEKVALPSGLKNLQFGDCFNQSMEKVALPSSLETLKFDQDFNQSMEMVALPSSLKNLEFGDCFNQSMEKVALPSSLETLKFGFCFNQSMEKVALPSSLKTLKFGFGFNQSMEKVALPSSVQILKFGCSSPYTSISTSSSHDAW